MNQDEALAATMNDLHWLARAVFDGVISDRDADAQRAEMCTRHGPAAVQVLDEFFEARLARIREGNLEP